MRTRQIKPAFFLDEDLAEFCCRDARLLFAGMWLVADREGRLEDRPKKLKHQIFPYDDDIDAERITALTDELERGRFVLRYGTNGHRYLFIRNFNKHQHIHHAEQGSELPEPPDDIEKPRTCPGQDPELPRTCPTASTSTYGIRHTASTSGRNAPRSPRTRKGARASQKTGAPDEFEPSERLKEWASKSFPLFNLNGEVVEDFLNHHRSKGNCFADWDAAFRTWVKNAATDFGRKDPLTGLPKPKETIPADTSWILSTGKTYGRKQSG